MATFLSASPDAQVPHPSLPTLTATHPLQLHDLLAYTAGISAGAAEFVSEQTAKLQAGKTQDVTAALIDRVPLYLAQPGHTRA